jgi:hypothetical protein
LPIEDHEVNNLIATGVVVAKNRIISENCNPPHHQTLSNFATSFFTVVPVDIWFFELPLCSFVASDERQSERSGTSAHNMQASNPVAFST